jgi:hypothetical protein
MGGAAPKVEAGGAGVVGYGENGAAGVVIGAEYADGGATVVEGVENGAGGVTGAP